MPISRKMLAVLCLSLAWPALAGAQEVQWLHDLNSARTAANEKDRPLLIDFGTNNCHWCKVLDATTFRDPAVAKLLAEKFITVKIDASKDPKLAQALGVNSFPTLIFAARDGTILSRQEGFVDAAKLQGQLQTTLAKSPTQQLAAQTPQGIQQPKIRMQAPDSVSVPPPMGQINLPSPDELGMNAPTNPSAAPKETTTAPGALFARLRQIGALGLHLEAFGTGYRACIDLPGTSNQRTTVEGVGTDEESAIVNALAKAAR